MIDKNGYPSVNPSPVWSKNGRSNRNLQLRLYKVESWYCITNMTFFVSTAPDSQIPSSSVGTLKGPS